MNILPWFYVLAYTGILAWLGLCFYHSIRARLSGATALVFACCILIFLLFYFVSIFNYADSLQYGRLRSALENMHTEACTSVSSF